MTNPIDFVDLDIINMALTGWLGEAPLSDLANDGTAIGIVMRQMYEITSESAQTDVTWRFNTTQIALNKLSTEPLARWSAAWQLPVDLLKVITTWPPTNYEIQGDKLFTNDTNKVDLTYQRKLPEALWQAWFTRYAVARLVLATVRGITGDDATAAMNQELDEARTQAFFQDAQQQPNQQNTPNEFIDVRF